MRKLILLIAIVIFIGTLFQKYTYAQKSIKFGYFTPTTSPIVESQPPNTPNAECTNAYAEENINRYRQAGLLDTLENAQQELLACDLYRYLNGCHSDTPTCTKPCIYIPGGPDENQIANFPGVSSNLSDLHTISTDLFRNYWIYTKGVGRFDLRQGFGLTADGKNEMAATLRTMTCAERSSEVGHHLQTPLYFYPDKTTHLIVTLPNGITTTVTANPSGIFSVGNQSYAALQYDIPYVSFTPPPSGIVIDGSHLNQELENIAIKLALYPTEKDNFLTYWKDKLPHANYYFVSLFDQKAAQKLTNWQIDPSPDTEIRYIFYFKPFVNKPNIKDHDIFTLIPRRGFSVVDWGGIIDW